ncbi:MAG: helix-turn-helix domain-containing protein [Planctomycetota bacterium]
MQRLRSLRMSEARGLLIYSSLNITQIAQYLDYPRVHEFSREFKKYFGVSPRDVRGK